MQATISLAEWRFAPAALTLPADSPAVLELRNTGGLAHEWALLSAVIAGESEFSDDNVAARLRLEPGATARLEFIVPERGDYQVVCPIGGHFSQGMVGSVTATG